MLRTSVLLLALAVMPAAALPTCRAASAQTYITYGAAGCAVGTFTIKSVAWDGGLGTVAVSAEDVELNPTISDGGVGLTFRSDKFDISGFDTILATLRYIIDPPPDILDDFQLSMEANSPEPPGFAYLDASVCAGGDPFSNSCAGGSKKEMQVYDLGSSSNLIDYWNFPGKVNTVGVNMMLRMGAAGASSQINGGGGWVVTVVPEPSAGLLAMGGMGLLALAKLRRRSG